jgi:hypothetical protein
VRRSVCFCSRYASKFSSHDPSFIGGELKDGSAPSRYGRATAHTISRATRESRTNAEPPPRSFTPGALLGDMAKGKRPGRDKTANYSVPMKIVVPVPHRLIRNPVASSHADVSAITAILSKIVI